VLGGGSEGRSLFGVHVGPILPRAPSERPSPGVVASAYIGSAAV
jgi:hypothetical protein